ncbi:homoserine dehydrogenase [Pseudohaliea rubra]|uniref:Homoserine dehydrogenase n=1 Tax=Pseudohaliea rubra DSM 19751 TaxID=1265313 RepID=A0A095VQC6_9GAMM|nr:homoserine dehydrogenase [Pseudohaliea rubra]KGE03632.1 Homoserine dehydrogenase [Pseudohaliea rubra DSM 19751]
MTAIRIGLCGIGTVGGGVLELLGRNGEVLAGRAGAPLEIVHVGARRDREGVATGSATVSRDVLAVAADPAVDILVEAIGGTEDAHELVSRALKAGKHVVTANKALIAEHGNELLALAEAQGVSLRFEAAVAGGIPIIKALREGLAANRVSWLAGIINGTGNFILTGMAEEEREFADVLAEAQALGYAEADPTFDVEGIDAAHKLVILAAIAFNTSLRFDAVYTEGISALTPEDLAYADELGYVVKHLGVARETGDGLELRVHPTLLPKELLLAKVAGVKNAVLVEGDAVGPTLYYGAGAGGGATASAVMADVIDLARELSRGQRCPLPSLGLPMGELRELPILPMGEVRTAWYLRLEAADRPGVMSQVSRILGDQGISIEALIQKAPQSGQTRVPVVVVTNVASQGNLERAVLAIEALESIAGPVTRIRIESLDG